MKRIVYSIFAILLWSSVSFSDGIVDQLGDEFITKIPLNWSFKEGSWDYFDVTKCFTQGQTCF